ncbi:CoA-binding protein [Nocardiopsis sp. frass1]
MTEPWPDRRTIDVLRRSEAAGESADRAVAIGARGVWFRLGVVDEEAFRRTAEAGVPMGTCPANRWGERGEITHGPGDAGRVTGRFSEETSVRRSGWRSLRMSGPGIRPVGGVLPGGGPGGRPGLPPDRAVRAVRLLIGG